MSIITFSIICIVYGFCFGFLCGEYIGVRETNKKWKQKEDVLDPNIVLDSTAKNKRIVKANVVSRKKADSVIYNIEELEDNE